MYQCYNLKLYANAPGTVKQGSANPRHRNFYSSSVLYSKVPLISMSRVHSPAAPPYSAVVCFNTVASISF